MHILGGVAKVTACTAAALAAAGGILLVLLYLGAEDDSLGAPEADDFEYLVTA